MLWKLKQSIFLTTKKFNRFFSLLTLEEKNICPGDWGRQDWHREIRMMMRKACHLSMVIYQYPKYLELKLDYCLTYFFKYVFNHESLSVWPEGHQKYYCMCPHTISEITLSYEGVLLEDIKLCSSVAIDKSLSFFKS